MDYHNSQEMAFWNAIVEHAALDIKTVVCIREVSNVAKHVIDESMMLLKRVTQRIAAHAAITEMQLEIAHESEEKWAYIRRRVHLGEESGEASRCFQRIDELRRRVNEVMDKYGHLLFETCTTDVYPTDPCSRIRVQVTKQLIAWLYKQPNITSNKYNDSYEFDYVALSKIAIQDVMRHLEITCPGHASELSCLVDRQYIQIDEKIT